MIRLCRPDDHAQVLHLTEGRPVVGALCRMHWRMLRENQRLPHRFYLVGEKALLKLSGGRATLCGPVQDAEELGAFLRFSGISQMTALGFFPPGWRLVETNTVMLRPADADAPLRRSPAGLERCPPAGEVLAVLESADGPIAPEAARSYFYADLCTRRNHGCAAIYGMREEGLLAATAGVWALDGTEGYLACVETRPSFRRRGLAATLLGVLCEEYGTRPLSLICRGELSPYYARFGFLKTNELGLISTAD